MTGMLIALAVLTALFYLALRRGYVEPQWGPSFRHVWDDWVPEDWEVVTTDLIPQPEPLARPALSD